jgi:hypothetical protein
VFWENNIQGFLQGNADGLKLFGNTITGTVTVKGSNQIIQQNIIQKLIVDGRYNSILSNTISGKGGAAINVLIGSENNSFSTIKYPSRDIPASN